MKKPALDTICVCVGAAGGGSRREENGGRQGRSGREREVQGCLPLQQAQLSPNAEHEGEMALSQQPPTP